MSDEDSEPQDDSSVTGFSASGALRIHKEILLQFNLVRSKKYVSEKIKPGEAKMYGFDDKLIFVRRLTDGSLKVAVVYNDDVLVFEL